MGCGASSEQPANTDGSSSNVNNNKNAHNGHKVTPINTPSKAKGESNNNDIQKKKVTEKPPSGKPVPKPVAFEVDIESQAAADSLLKKAPPKRLQRLTPLENAPKLTADQLQDKIRLAEEKRLQELEKKKSVAGKSSRLRRQLQEAKRFEAETVAEHTQKQLEEKQQSAGKNRESKQKELEERRRKREERARKAKERAAQQKVENGEDIDYEIEQDEGYNADDGDSWLEGENNTAAPADALHSETSGLSERLYSGRSSPHKPSARRGSAERAARMSAFSTSTADSFDYAFQRKPPLAPVEARDDFFDS